jgi:WD40-like Beta Propeller Repeat
MKTIAVRSVIVGLLVVAGASIGSAQQFGPWSPPTNLGVAVNTSFQDQHPALSKNGLSLYLASNRPGGLGALDIWVSRREAPSDPWETPIPVPNINSAALDNAPNLSTDGHFLFFHSERSDHDVNNQAPCGGLDLYVAHRKDKFNDLGWEPPVNLGCTINSALNDAGPNIFADPVNGEIHLYFTRLLNPAMDDWEIYKGTLNGDGTWSLPNPVPEFIGPGRDTRTALRRRDGLEMIISSVRPGTLGSQDLWVSRRDSTFDPWSALENLGPVVNAPTFDGAPALSWDGTLLLFFSARPNGLGGNDLYASTRIKVTGH